VTVTQLPPRGVGGPGAKARILDTALRLFYDDGIRGVGVDRIIAEASVTKATFYKHYGSKDTLVLQYIRTAHERMRNELDRLAAEHGDARETVLAFMTATADEVRRPGFRGDPFLNAAAEFADPVHPVRQVVTAHRDWLTERLTGLLSDAGHPMPGDGADELVLARDGAMSGGYAGDAVAASTALGRAVDWVLDSPSS